MDDDDEAMMERRVDIGLNASADRATRAAAARTFILYIITALLIYEKEIA